MLASRRECLKMGLAAGAGASLAGCAMVAQRVSGLEESGRSRILSLTSEEQRILSLIGFGPTRASVAAFRKLGRHDFIENELTGGDTEDLSLLMQLQRLDVLQLEAVDMIDLPLENVLGQLQQAAILQ